MQDMIVLVRPLIPALRRYARAHVHETAAADDLVQDCLERAITRWRQRRPDSDVRPWLFQILHRLAIDRARRIARRGAHLPIEEADESAVARPASQESALRHKELVAALDALPEEQRSVILLVSVEGFSYAEAADALDVPIGTVMSRLSRGREKLLKSLDPDASQTKAPHLWRVK